MGFPTNPGKAEERIVDRTMTAGGLNTPSKPSSETCRQL